MCLEYWRKKAHRGHYHCRHCDDVKDLKGELRSASKTPFRTKRFLDLTQANFADRPHDVPLARAGLGYSITAFKNER